MISLTNLSPCFHLSLFVFQISFRYLFHLLFFLWSPRSPGFLQLVHFHLFCCRSWKPWTFQCLNFHLFLTALLMPETPSCWSWRFDCSAWALRGLGSCCCISQQEMSVVLSLLQGVMPLSGEEIGCWTASRYLNCCFRIVGHLIFYCRKIWWNLPCCRCGSRIEAPWACCK